MMVQVVGHILAPTLQDWDPLSEEQPHSLTDLGTALLARLGKDKSLFHGSVDAQEDRCRVAICSSVVWMQFCEPLQCCFLDCIVAVSLYQQVLRPLLFA